MDLLEFGMQNERSRSVMRKVLAKGALAAEKKKADLYDKYLEHKIPLSKNTFEDTVLLHRIRKRISEQGTC